MTDSTTLKAAIQEHMKLAMKARDQRRLGIIRLMLAAIKQVEVDERKELTDNDTLAILDKMVKQRRDAKDQYEKAERTDLAEQEAYEIAVVEEFLPEQLSQEEIQSIVTAIIAEAGATGPKDMGKVMGLIKPKVQGKADMRQVSELIKQSLAG